jgi:transketolase
MRKTSLDMVHTLARRDPRVVFIGSDLGPGVLDDMKNEMPDRFFMEGVSEQNVVGMAAGLAMEGYVPYVNTIATFLTRRCFDQVAIDLCLQNLPVRLIANGGGLVYAPLGPTHLAIEDIAIMRALPNMTVVCPCDAEEMARFMAQSTDYPGPIYIRLAKGGDTVVSRADNRFEIGRAIELRRMAEIVFVATGVMTQRALAAAELLAANGIAAGVLHMHTVKPLDIAALGHAGTTARLIVTVEEHTLTGGLGSAVAEALADNMGYPPPRLQRLGIPDMFPKTYGSQEEMLETFGLNPEGIAAKVRATWAEITAT